MSEKKKIVAIILLVLLGGVGGHDFYARKTIAGFVHLILFVAWLWMLLFGSAINIYNSGLYAAFLLAANGIFVFVELIMLLVSPKYGECVKW